MAYVGERVGMWVSLRRLDTSWEKVEVLDGVDVD
jgi:hypothetical protein